MQSLRSVLRLTPGRAISGAFGLVLAVGTFLLSLPIAVQGRSATFMEALFTATSALCVTGHIVVDTPVFWSPFGQGVILVLLSLIHISEPTRPY